MQIEKVPINDRGSFQKYSENFTFQLFIFNRVIHPRIFLFNSEVVYFLTVSVVFPCINKILRL